MKIFLNKVGIITDKLTLTILLGRMLETMGYSITKLDYDFSTFKVLINNFAGNNHDVSNITLQAANNKVGYTIFPERKHKLFLALAASTNEKMGSPCEYFKCIENVNGFNMGGLYRVVKVSKYGTTFINDDMIPYTFSKYKLNRYFVKASDDDLYNVFDTPDKWYIEINGDNKELCKDWMKLNGVDIDLYDDSYLINKACLSDSNHKVNANMGYIIEFKEMLLYGYYKDYVKISTEQLKNMIFNNKFIKNHKNISQLIMFFNQNHFA